MLEKWLEKMVNLSKICFFNKIIQNIEQRLYKIIKLNKIY